MHVSQPRPKPSHDGLGFLTTHIHTHIYTHTDEPFELLALEAALMTMAEFLQSKVRVCSAERPHDGWFPLPPYRSPHTHRLPTRQGFMAWPHMPSIDEP